MNGENLKPRANEPEPAAAKATGVGGEVVMAPRRRRILPFAFTLAMAAVATAFSWSAWRAYMETAWTRDGTIRVYVVTIAAEVAGRIVQLPVKDNQFVRKGDLLILIDPTDYTIAVRQAEAQVQQAKVTAQNALAESNRRQKLNQLAVTVEEQQTYLSRAESTDAAYQQALAALDRARVNLDRTRIVSPVNGYVTNLLAQLGDYANVGQNKISVVNADSFWVDGYFEETHLGLINEGDPAIVKLMGYDDILEGHVDSVARGIKVANAQPDPSGLASVNPIFTFVRLAQRVPVRVHLDATPKSVRLVAGMTATVQVNPRQVNPRPKQAAPKPAR